MAEYNDFLKFVQPPASPVADPTDAFIRDATQRDPLPAAIERVTKQAAAYDKQRQVETTNENAAWALPKALEIAGIDERQFRLLPGSQRQSMINLVFDQEHDRLASLHPEAFSQPGASRQWYDKFAYGAIDYYGSDRYHVTPPEYDEDVSVPSQFGTVDRRKPDGLEGADPEGVFRGLVAKPGYGGHWLNGVGTPSENAPQLFKSLFPGARITSNLRAPGKHASEHTNNHAAIDIDPSSLPGWKFRDVVAALTRNGIAVLSAYNEVERPSPGATGPHWHFRLGERPLTPRQQRFDAERAARQSAGQGAGPLINPLTGRVEAASLGAALPGATRLNPRPGAALPAAPRAAAPRAAARPGAGKQPLFFMDQPKGVRRAARVSADPFADAIQRDLDLAAQHRPAAGDRLLKTPATLRSRNMTFQDLYTQQKTRERAERFRAALPKYAEDGSVVGAAKQAVLDTASNVSYFLDRMATVIGEAQATEHTMRAAAVTGLSAKAAGARLAAIKAEARDSRVTANATRRREQADIAAISTDVNRADDAYVSAQFNEGALPGLKAALTRGNYFGRLLAGQIPTLGVVAVGGGVGAVLGVGASVGAVASNLAIAGLTGVGSGADARQAAEDMTPAERRALPLFQEISRRMGPNADESDVEDVFSRTLELKTAVKVGSFLAVTSMLGMKSETLALSAFNVGSQILTRRAVGTATSKVAGRLTLGKAAGQLALETGGEYAEEFGQNAIEQTATGKPLDVQQANSAGLLGALAGGALGGASIGLEVAAHPRQTPTGTITEEDRLRTPIEFPASVQAFMEKKIKRQLAGSQLAQDIDAAHAELSPVIDTAIAAVAKTHALNVEISSIQTGNLDDRAAPVNAPSGAVLPSKREGSPAASVSSEPLARPVKRPRTKTEAKAELIAEASPAAREDRLRAEALDLPASGPEVEATLSVSDRAQKVLQGVNADRALFSGLFVKGSSAGSKATSNSVRASRILDYMQQQFPSVPIETREAFTAAIVARPEVEQTIAIRKVVEANPEFAELGARYHETYVRANELATRAAVLSGLISEMKAGLPEEDAAPGLSDVSQPTEYGFALPERLTPAQGKQRRKIEQAINARAARAARGPVTDATRDVAYDTYIDENGVEQEYAPGERARMATAPRAEPGGLVRKANYYRDVITLQREEGVSSSLEDYYHARNPVAVLSRITTTDLADQAEVLDGRYREIKRKQARDAGVTGPIETAPLLFHAMANLEPQTRQITDTVEREIINPIQDQEAISAAKLGLTVADFRAKTSVHMLSMSRRDAAFGLWVMSEERTQHLKTKAAQARAAVLADLNAGTINPQAARVALTGIMSDPASFTPGTFVALADQRVAGRTSAQHQAEIDDNTSTALGDEFEKMADLYKEMITRTRDLDRQAGFGGPGLDSLLDMLGESHHVVDTDQKVRRVDPRFEDNDNVVTLRKATNSANKKLVKREGRSEITITDDGEKKTNTDAFDSALGRLMASTRRVADREVLLELARVVEGINDAEIGSVSQPQSRVVDGETGAASHGDVAKPGDLNKYTLWGLGPNADQHVTITLTDPRMKEAMVRRHENTQELGVVGKATRVYSQLQVMQTALRIKDYTRTILSSTVPVTATFGITANPRFAANLALGLLPALVYHNLRPSLQVKMEEAFAGVPLFGKLVGEMGERRRLMGTSSAYQLDRQTSPFSDSINKNKKSLEALAQISKDARARGDSGVALKAGAQIAGRGAKALVVGTLKSPMTVVNMLATGLQNNMADASYSLAIANKATPLQATAFVRQVLGNVDQRLANTTLADAGRDFVPTFNSSRVGLNNTFKQLFPFGEVPKKTEIMPDGQQVQSVDYAAAAKAISYPAVMMAMAVPAALTYYAAQLGKDLYGDDDDDEDGIPNRERSNALSRIPASEIMMNIGWLIEGRTESVSETDDQGTYVTSNKRAASLKTLQINYGATSLLASLGVGSALLAQGTHTPEQVVTGLVDLFSRSLNPIGLVNAEQQSEDIANRGVLRTLSDFMVNSFGSLATPLAQVALNRNTFGSPVYTAETVKPGDPNYVPGAVYGGGNQLKQENNGDVAYKSGTYQPFVDGAKQFTGSPVGQLFGLNSPDVLQFLAKEYTGVYGEVTFAMLKAMRERGENPDAVVTQSLTKTLLNPVRENRSGDYAAQKIANRIVADVYGPLDRARQVERKADMDDKHSLSVVPAGSRAVPERITIRTKPDVRGPRETAFINRTPAFQVLNQMLIGSKDPTTHTHVGGLFSKLGGLSDLMAANNRNAEYAGNPFIAAAPDDNLTVTERGRLKHTIEMQKERRYQEFVSAWEEYENLTGYRDGIANVEPQKATP